MSTLSAASTRQYRDSWKRLFDVSMVLICLPSLIPLAPLIAGLVCACAGRPVVFRQLRSGFHERTFELLRFRTMTSKHDADDQLLINGLFYKVSGYFLA